MSACGLFISLHDPVTRDFGSYQDDDKLTHLTVVKTTDVNVFQDPDSAMSPVFLTDYKQSGEVIHGIGQSGP